MSNSTDKAQGLYLFATGLMMGLADLVPGISGGTVAFVMGVYDAWIGSLHRILSIFLRWFFRKNTTDQLMPLTRAFFVLIMLGSGIASSLFLLSPLWHKCVLHFPFHVNGFFFGLIAMSSCSLAYETGQWEKREVLWSLLGACAMFVVLWIKPHDWSVTPISLILCGALAACAMVLPGISGSYVLVLTGHYPVFIESLAQRDFAPLLYLFAGVGLGMAMFIHILHLMLQFHRKAVTAFMTGLVIVSLIKVWPWQVASGESGHPLESLRLPEPGEPLGGVIIAVVMGALLGTVFLHWGMNRLKCNRNDHFVKPESALKQTEQKTAARDLKRTVDVFTAHEMWLNKQALFIDMRRKEDFERSHIPEAVWWDRSFDHLPEPLRQKTKPIILYCYKGISSKRMIDEHFNDQNDILSLECGFEEWVKNFTDDVSSHKENKE